MSRQVLTFPLDLMPYSQYSTRSLVSYRGATAGADANHHTGPGHGGRTGLQSGIRPPSPRAQWDDGEASRKAQIH